MIISILKKGCKYYLFTALLTFFYDSSIAQKEYNSWIFSDSCSIIFGNTLQVNTIPTTLVAGNDAVICDKRTGQLLFYSDGENAYDRNDEVMPNGAGLYGCAFGSQGALIVPDPADDFSYYLFTTDCTAIGGTNGLNYNIVDMRLNGGLGDVTQKNIFVCDNLSEKVTAVRACTFDGFWVITFVDSAHSFFAYKLTLNGLDIDSPVISPTGFPGYNHKDDFYDEGYLKASPNGNMLMAAYGEVKTDTCAYLYSFDKITGLISLLAKVPWSNVPDTDLQADFGVSFSPDNSKVYFTNLRNPQSYNLYQYDLNTTQITFIFQNNTNTGVTGLQLGPDGKIYVADSKFDSLGVINQPNLAGVSCNYNNDGVSIAPHLMYFDLPNNIDALYYPDTLFAPNFSYTATCTDTFAAFTDNSNITPQEWWWSFGDVASGSNNHSALQNPTHHFTQPGTYTVNMWAYEGCSVDSVIKTVTVTNCVKQPQFIIPTLIYGLGSQTQWQIINLPQGNNSVTIYDELGRVIYVSNNYPNDYDMRNLPPAMYFYRLTLVTGQVYVGKIVLVK